MQSQTLQNLLQERILVVEDSSDFQLMVQASLGPNYPVTVTGSLGGAREQLASKQFRLLVLDINLPDGDGFGFCQELRANESTRFLPVIFLSGRADLEDKLKGFSLGADDYIVKPFESLELRARVEAKLVRERNLLRSEGVLARGVLRLDLPILRASVVESTGKKIDLGLTPIEFKILFHLARNENQVVSREQLLATVWGHATHVFDRATDKHVSSLRQKLGVCACYIETVSRVGYRFTVKPV